jgi:hypothetical protein
MIISLVIAAKFLELSGLLYIFLEPSRRFYLEKASFEK